MGYGRRGSAGLIDVRAIGVRACCMSQPTSPDYTILDAPARLALAYAPAHARPAWEALLLFERRLADTARPGRDPMMIQLRLAWWRDRLGEPASAWPKGEPLLARLTVWDSARGALKEIVNGWEASVVGDDGGVELAGARIAAYVALGRLLDVSADAAVRMVASDVVRPETAQGPAPRLPRPMRPLSILRDLSMREARHGRHSPVLDILRILRIGVLGR